jgi:hypothetical protein
MESVIEATPFNAEGVVEIITPLLMISKKKCKNGDEIRNTLS